MAASERLATDLGPYEKIPPSYRRESLRGLLALFNFTQGKYGQVDLVFASPGVPRIQNSFKDVYDEDGDLVKPGMAVVDVHLKSVALTAKLAMSYFQKKPRPGGGLVLTCSTSRYNERPNLSLYSAATTA
ncbi:hypothetical protein B0A52_02156 [Exophiala mesophila]|uniref:Uncharacterized protein n=1 Tax=Exophiala mesophila TaxID=212818 RepID=A0A438NBK3_EXOME|nr:hypothetical protein B0A52_02156 [Exophiala mesophila]